MEIIYISVLRNAKSIMIAALLFFMIGHNVYSQDPHFSQYYASPLYLNPSFAGSAGKQRVVLNNRIQWLVLPNAFNTYSISYDFVKPQLRSGFGLLATTDRAGEASLRSTTAGLIYSYKIQAENRWVITPSVYFGYGSRTMNYNELIFGDQIEFGNNAAPSIDPVTNELENLNYFDAGSGILMYNKNTWVGASFYHLNQPSISFLDREDRIPMKFTVHAGTQIIIDRGWVNRNNQSYLTMSAVYFQQGPFNQMDFGVTYHIDPILMGVSFRGIPFKQNVSNNQSRDAVVFSTGLRYSQINFIYSYDFTISELGVKSQGTHEISMEFTMDTRINPKKVPRSMKILPCPSYIPYESYKIKKRN